MHGTNSTMGFGMLEMHESFNFNVRLFIFYYQDTANRFKLSILKCNYIVYKIYDFEMQQSQSQHIGDKSCQFFLQSLRWPNISGIPNIPRIHLYFGQQDMLQGGTFPFQTSMISQKFGMHPFLYHDNVSQVCIFSVSYI